MKNLKIIATTSFGLEAIVKKELLDLGYKDLEVCDGKVAFIGTTQDIVRTNLWLRSADRILLELGEFKALSFEELFEKTKAFLGKNGLL